MLASGRSAGGRADSARTPLLDAGTEIHTFLHIDTTNGPYPSKVTVNTVVSGVDFTVLRLLSLSLKVCLGIKQTVHTCAMQYASPGKT